jgi:hypothetical protein
MPVTRRDGDRVRLCVELDRETEPPSGWVEDETGARRVFTSLLELIALLESSRTRREIPP